MPEATLGCISANAPDNISPKPVICGMKDCTLNTSINIRINPKANKKISGNVDVEKDAMSAGLKFILKPIK